MAIEYDAAVARMLHNHARVANAGMKPGR
jgi:hypothetical protein